MEFHSALTSFNDMLPYIKDFFDAQEKFCKQSFNPLAVCMDCAKGIQTLFLIALCQRGSNPLTRMQYNNVILCLCGFFENSNFNNEAGRPVFQLIHQLVPTYLIVCRPHVVRAARGWITSKDRDISIRSQVRLFKIMIMTLLNGGTSSMTCCETIVLTGLIMYITTQPHIKAAKSDILTKSEKASREDIRKLNERVTAFFRSTLAKVKGLLAKHCSEVLDAGAMTSKMKGGWIGSALSTMVATDAMNANLDMTFTFCEDHQGKDESLHTIICLGLLPNTPKKGTYPTYSHFVAQRQPKSIAKIRHTVPSSVICGSNTDIVLIPNPAYSKQVCDYVVHTWAPVIASINSSIRHIIFFQQGAVIDNSNTVSESYFKHVWSNPEDQFFCRDIGLYMQHYQNKTNQSNRQFIKDLESLRRHATTSQFQRKIMQPTVPTAQYNHEEMKMREEDCEEFGWSRGDHQTKPARMATDLHILLSKVVGISPDDRARQYQYIKNHLESDSRHIQPMSATVFDRWMTLTTKKPKFMSDHELTDSLDGLLDDLRKKQNEMDVAIGDLNAVSIISDENQL
eukprot:scaffold23582_cov91-Cyclotella_meneghiniana.AAC.1